MTQSFYNPDKTLRIILDSEMWGVITTFWVLERRAYHWYGNSWEHICRVEWDEVEACKKKHDLRPLWERV